MQVTDEMVRIFVDAFLQANPAARRTVGLKEVRAGLEAALRAAPAAGIRPLRFEAQDSDKTLYVSEVSIAGEYRVSHVGDGWEVSVRGCVVAREQTAEKAKAAAQADYERRIRSALVAAAPTEAGR